MCCPHSSGLKVWIETYLWTSHKLSLARYLETVMRKIASIIMETNKAGRFQTCSWELRCSGWGWGVCALRKPLPGAAPQLPMRPLLQQPHAGGIPAWSPLWKASAVLGELACHQQAAWLWLPAMDVSKIHFQPHFGPKPQSFSSGREHAASQFHFASLLLVQRTII